MAIRPADEYPAQVDVTAGHPHGKARNSGAFQDGTGTPLEAKWLNDTWGFQQALLAAAGMTPSGDPDEVGASDYLLALEIVTAAAGELAAERVMLGNWQDFGSFPAGTGYALAWLETPALFIAVGASGAIRTSPDGVTWTARTSGTVQGLQAAAQNAAATVIVVVGNSGVIVRSIDGGVTWSLPSSGVVSPLASVAWFNGAFVAVGDPGVILTSPDGVTWTARTSGTAQGLTGIALDGASGVGTLLVVVGTNGTILTSPDGVTWTARTSGTTELLYAVAWKAGLFCAVGNDGTILTSPDGVTWTARTSGTTQILLAIIATGRHFVVVGAGSTVLGSSDGTGWDRVVGVTAALTLASVAWSGRVCIACNTNDDLIRSFRRIAL